MTRAEAYAEAAIRGELEELRGTAEGGRNHATYATAARLGGFVAAGTLDATTAEALLLEAALATGLPREEALPTLRRGLAAGQLSPVGLPTEDGASVGRWSSPTSREKEDAPPPSMGAPPPPPLPAEGLDAWRLRGTRLPSVRDRDGKLLDLSWIQLLEGFGRPTILEDAAGKGELPAWTAGTYRGGAGPHDLRGGVELLEASALVLDLDARTEPAPKGATEEAVLEHTLRGGERLPPDRLESLLAEVLPGVAWAAHSTASSTPSAWRWRLVIPLAEPLPGAAYTVAVDALREHFLASSAPLALESDATHNRKPTGLSFRPATTDAEHYRVLSSEGGLLNWRDLLDGFAAGLRLRGTTADPGYVSELGRLLEERCKRLRERAAREARKREEKLARIEALGFIRPGSEWLLEEPPPREYLLHLPEPAAPDGRGAGFLARGVPGIISAGGGTGKTFALVGLALALATRTPWLGRYPVGRRTIGRAVLLLGEETREEVQRRIYAQARALGLSKVAIEGRLLILPGAGAGSLALTQPEEGGRPADTPFAEELYGYLKAEAGPGWDAVIVDPLSHFAGPDVEKDNAAATRLLQVLTRFTRLPGGPVVLLAHHERKPGVNEDASSATVRGSSAIVDNARWVARLYKEREIPPPLGGYGLARLAVVKSNYAPPSEAKGDLLLRVEGGALRAPTAEEARFLGPVEPRLEDMRPGPKTISDRAREREDKLETEHKLALIRAGDDPAKRAKVEAEHKAKVEAARKAGFADMTRAERTHAERRRK